MQLLANGGIQAVVNAIKNLIEFIKLLWTFISNVISSIILALTYLVQIIPKILVIIATLPSWLIAFATITMGVSIAYFIIGRNTGKSDK